MKFDTRHREILQQILKWRRDIRHFRTDPVEEDVLLRLQMAMDLSPSVGNARPWRVLRIETPSLRAAVRANFMSENARAANRYGGAQADAYHKLKLAGLDRAPVQLAVFTDTNPSEGHGLGRQTMPETLHQSTSMAIHTLWLAARAENLGLGMVSILDPHAIEQLLDVPESWCFTAWLCLGHPETKEDTPLLHRVGWQENTPTLWQMR
ncbi:5,6-dimethylbenzimidazole synthase [Roseinatronobacter bogoriensis]|uniref:5,6-dimethylbenzimidazole synthase n=1 Tax=Roseinatronobacter bogoriensis subsp. barguzinensis TaxID=441209 RepID=A0A2K8KCT8_9RHOB|nr:MULTISPECIES: 5,6-dimethylbenzimidazole synthase [Rhodobaca]ATX67262.1 5,6-dimethylbenzimidazole synthase [Rhodobaca barguzinensis]MBB4206814.1 5,6-dimethylbenzimidazole synthase [Rhodobaca bogoriensis DSM 18756]TDW41558.1 cob(II)yrinic acid a,c-diamide reductase [Rhodobaca barguzinensis]TDY74264.1 cob(II)yrinic acid a,c-diamide reductase [Rhodobaca bogoriensis DSM 18756]